MRKYENIQDGINKYTLNKVNTDFKYLYDVINDRGTEILSEESFLIWLEENGIKHREEVASFSVLPSNDSLNTVRGVADENKIYIKKENGWVAFQTIDINKINTVEEKVDDITVNVRSFGAVGDGTTNDRAAILAAKTEAIRLDAELYIPSGNFYINGNLDLTGVRFIKAIGSITFENSENKLTIAHDSRRANNKVYRIGDIFVGRVELLGMKNAEFHIAYTKHLRLFADSSDTTISSIAYNSFYPGRIDYLEYDSLNSGWINENKWFGGRIIKVEIGGEYTHNHNIFYAPTMERTGSPAEIIINRGSSNRFYNVRWENPDSTNRVVFGESAWDNTVERSWAGAPHGYQQNSYRFGTVIDNGVGNSVLVDMDKHTTFEEVFQLSKANTNFNTNEISDNESTLTVLFDGVYDRVFDTGIFKIDEDFGFEIYSDGDLWRTAVRLFDGNKQSIVDTDALNSFTMSWATNIENPYFQTSVTRDRSAFSFKKTSKVEYMQISITAQKQGSFEYLKAYVRRQNSGYLTIPTLPIHNTLRGTRPPNSVDFQDGIICWNTSNADGSAIGWKLSGDVWKPFGELNFNLKAKSGTYTDSGTGGKSFWTIPHGLGEAPKRFGVTALNEATGNARIKYINPTGANLIVFTNTTIVEGTENVQYHWWVEA